jgi:hypothetical protein
MGGVAFLFCIIYNEHGHVSLNVILNVILSEAKDLGLKDSSSLRSSE